ncbi:MAG TPA: phosphatase PAP2 family protein [Chitinophagaceae bacterium]|nr:phosphatase PAP2 family protein [Chitinophagaceae bacterium]
MKFTVRLIVTIFLLVPVAGFSQQKDTLVHKLDSLSKKTDSTGGQLNNTNPAAYNETTKLTLKSYFTLLGSDLKQAFTKPFHMERKDWGRFVKFGVVVGGLTYADRPIQRYVATTTKNNPGISKISNKVTTFGGLYEIYTLTAFGTFGIIFKKQKMVTTTLLASQAYITGSALENIGKLISGRRRPSVYNNGDQPRPTFLGPFSNGGKDVNGNKLYSSFPSGHTTVVFAAATVFAKEYQNTLAIPIIAYSAATLVGISRVVENAHWATDVLAGAALGYLSGRLIVNNYHRLAKIKAPEQNKGTVSFNLQYNNGIIMPGVIYNFR